MNESKRVALEHTNTYRSIIPSRRQLSPRTAGRAHRISTLIYSVHTEIQIVRGPFKSLLSIAE